MKKLINRILVKKSIRPYKVVPLSTGVIVEHYRNGKLKTEYYGPLENAYDKLRGLDIEYNSELLTIMSNLASEAFSVGYNKAVKNTQEVYKKVYEL